MLQIVIDGVSSGTQKEEYKIYIRENQASQNSLIVNCFSSQFSFPFKLESTKEIC
jgi:hypothetical protein